MEKFDKKDETVDRKNVNFHRNRHFGQFNIGSGPFFYVDFISGPGFANKDIKNRFFDRK